MSLCWYLSVRFDLSTLASKHLTVSGCLGLRVNFTVVGQVFVLVHLLSPLVRYAFFLA